MANSYRQDTRVGELKTPLGKDTLVLVRFDGVEGVSEPFEYRIEALSSRENIDFDGAIGKHCTLVMNTIDNRKRYFDGILTEVQWMGIRDGGFLYRLVLRPWLWVLSQRRNSLIFHNKTAPEIISLIFGKHAGLANFDQAGLSKPYPQLEYTVQYRESDMAFVCRLMEHHGISYMFEHTDGAHKLILFDTVSGRDPIPGGQRPYYPLTGQYRRDEEHFYHWIPERRLTTGKTTLNDYEFKTPSAQLLVERTGDAAYEHGKLESYDYPGKYVKQQQGSTYVQSRLDMERASDGRFLASGDCIGCAPGMLVELAKHPTKELNKTYFALRCTHSFLAEAYSSGAIADSSETYQGNYEFLRADRSYAPPVVTEKPFVHGPQTAKVVGPKGEEIHCDEFGRILVRFHWDRENDNSMWCRVAQVWAGRNWGGVFIPRIGMEVVVEFLEGDPDQPLVVGCVYNGDNKPPFDLPGNKNINGWKSNSTIGGDGYNELVFDDTKTKEVIRAHAQRDLDTTVENDERRTIHHDRKTTIDNDETHKVGKDRKTNIGKNDKLDVGDTLTIEAGKQITLKVGGSEIVIDGQSITVKALHVGTKGMVTAKHEAAATLTVKGGMVLIN